MVDQFFPAASNAFKGTFLLSERRLPEFGGRSPLPGQGLAARDIARECSKRDRLAAILQDF